MYATVFKKAPLDPTLGRLYRDKVLLPGGSKEEMEMLKVCNYSALDEHTR
jgi:Zn-dependent oligopeptidase